MIDALGLDADVRAIDQPCSSNCHWVFAADGSVLGYFGTAFSRKVQYTRSEYTRSEYTRSEHTLRNYSLGTELCLSCDTTFAPLHVCTWATALALGRS